MTGPRPPLRRSLVGLLLVLTAGALAIAAAVSVVGLRSYLLDRTDDQLVTAAAVVRERWERVGADGDPGALRSAVALGDYVVEVRTRSGEVVRLGAPTPGLDTGVVVDAAPPGGAPATVMGYRVAVSADSDGRLVALALPLAPVDATVRRLALVELVTAGIVLTLLALLARTAVGSALRPLARVTAAAQRVAAGDLDPPLPVPPGPGDRTEAGRLVTSVHEMLARIRTALADGEASRTRLRDFLADASHELRTPLTTVRGYLQLVAGDPATPPAHRAALARADAEAGRMAALVEDLLTLSRLEALPLTAPADASGTAGDLAAVARAAVADALAVTPGRPVQLTVSGEAPHRVRLDDRLARQVVDNLLANAGQHAGWQVPVEVRVERVEDGGAPQVRLTVRDGGPGVPTEIAGRVFERFVHGPRSAAADGALPTGGHGGGSGLGLAIVAEVAAAAGGTVNLTTAPGAGTSVEVLLPAAPAGPPAVL